MSKNPALAPLSALKGVGPTKEKSLNKLGLLTVRDLLYHLPERYEHRRGPVSIKDLKPSGMQAVICTVEQSRLSHRGKIKLVELKGVDQTGSLLLKWFNQPWLANKFRNGQRYLFSGPVKYSGYSRSLEMENPLYVRAETESAASQGAESLLGLHPVYPLTGGINQKTMRQLVGLALEGFLDGIKDVMPSWILAAAGLPPLVESLRKVHAPEGADLAGLAKELNDFKTAWQQRLAFDELFMLACGLTVLRGRNQKEKGIEFKAPQRKPELLDRFLSSLPFELTSGQSAALKEILKDMSTPHPLNRLLQGDVGCGKTVVAAAAMLRAVECGYQAALMAPTEILASQHQANLAAMLDGLGISTALLSSSVKDRPLQQIKSGAVNIVIGTHALIQDAVEFHRLGFVVIDEQHRFGVEQRATLRNKAIGNPDVLVMTATPIPRTLALTAFGDLDVSTIKGLPPGRTPVRTDVVYENEKAVVYEAVSETLKEGGQCYVVYPLIEEDENAELKSAERGYEGLKLKFPDAQIALLHSRVPVAEKEEIMAGFKSKATDILAGTTVIEVGVDVPDASLMVIVHAERFGLSQLHQLRGRVGRGRRKSRCILLAYPPLSPEGRKRLGVMHSTTDGFTIAEEDLKLRGPGELLGRRQSGMPTLATADLARDFSVFELARKEAAKLVAKDPELLGYPELRGELENFWRGKIEIIKTG